MQVERVLSSTPILNPVKRNSLSALYYQAVRVFKKLPSVQPDERMQCFGFPCIEYKILPIPIEKDQFFKMDQFFRMGFAGLGDGKTALYARYLLGEPLGNGHFTAHMEGGLFKAMDDLKKAKRLFGVWRKRALSKLVYHDYLTRTTVYSPDERGCYHVRDHFAPGALDQFNGKNLDNNNGSWNPRRFKACLESFLKSVRENGLKTEDFCQTVTNSI